MAERREVLVRCDGCEIAVSGERGQRYPETHSACCGVHEDDVPFFDVMRFLDQRCRCQALEDRGAGDFVRYLCWDLDRLARGHRCVFRVGTRRHPHHPVAYG